MNIIDEVLTRDEFKEKPPVLVDIGASGKIHKKWLKIAKYSICLAFEPDERDADYLTGKNSGFKQIIYGNYIASDHNKAETDFYLTSSPHCSSTLEPDNESLKDWYFSNLFNIAKKVSLMSKNISTALKEAGIDKIDWFKTDSQGTDLRLFKSIDENIINKILVAEFEPGIIDAYKGEDKLFSLMGFMDKKNFWVSGMNVLGTQRIKKETLLQKVKINNFNQKLVAPLKISPCWCEITYINDFKNDFVLNKRDLLLGWVFLIIQQQYGFALEKAIDGYKRFNDPLFLRLEEYTINKMKKISIKKIADSLISKFSWTV